MALGMLTATGQICFMALFSGQCCEYAFLKIMSNIHVSNSNLAILLFLKSFYFVFEPFLFVLKLMIWNNINILSYCFTYN